MRSGSDNCASDDFSRFPARISAATVRRLSLDRQPRRNQGQRADASEQSGGDRQVQGDALANQSRQIALSRECVQARCYPTGSVTHHEQREEGLVHAVRTHQRIDVFVVLRKLSDARAPRCRITVTAQIERMNGNAARGQVNGESLVVATVRVEAMNRH